MDDVENEEWRPIPGWEGIYEVSDLGRVKSLGRWIPVRGQEPRRVAEKVMRGSFDTKGYPRVCLSVDNTYVRRYVHQLVALAFIGPLPPGAEVCHADGDRINCRASNLRYDTHDANMKDASRHKAFPLARRTHCPRKHLLLPYNLVPSALPRRDCLACSRARVALWVARKAGRVVGTLQEVSDRHYEILLRDFAKSGDQAEALR